MRSCPRKGANQSDRLKRESSKGSETGDEGARPAEDRLNGDSMRSWSAFLPRRRCSHPE